MIEQFYPLKIVGIDKLIRNATTLSLSIPLELQNAFKFIAGQHLNFRFLINGKEERRMYSLHNSPYEDELYKVTVKIHEGGLVSNYVAEHLKIGDTVEVMQPLGNFIVEPNEKTRKTYYMFAAGSGITPIYSMLKTILLAEPLSRINLLYGNRGQKDILFYKELTEWQAKYSERLNITYTLSKRFIDESLSPWAGKRGRINDDMVDAFITENPPSDENNVFYICGPNEMNQNVKNVLYEFGFPDRLIHLEYFSADAIEYDESLTSVEQASVSASIRNKNYQVQLKKDETILQGLKRIGAPVPFSCQNGICGTCKAHLLDGEVKMKASIALSSEEVKNNAILTCQSLVQSSNVKVKFD